MQSPTHLLSAIRLIELYAARALSPVVAVQAALDAIARFNPRLRALCLVDPERALAAAKQSEARWMRGAPLGSLDGIPTTIKDLILTRGWPTLRGSRLVDPDQDWSEDALLVGNLRRAGAILIGKSATPEFGWKGVTDSPLCGITRNPWNTALTPGGSSGGAAVAAACGMGALHVGSDGGGSIRIPASFTGVVGFKPSYGLVPRHPVSPFGTLSTGGPIARSVADAALMMGVLAKGDDRDFNAVPYHGPPFDAALDGGIAGWRIAFSPTLSGARVDPEVAEVVAGAAAVLGELGAVVDEVPRVTEDCLAVFQTHWFAGAANLLRPVARDQRHLLDPGLAHVAEQGARIPAMDYLDAVRARDVIAGKMQVFFRDWDLLVTPTMPIAAFATGADFPPQSGRGRWTDWTPFTYPFNLAKQPAISIPCGFTRAGLPVGLQIAGPLFADQRVLRAAHAFEQARPFRFPEI